MLVALDGSGDYNNLQDAIDAIPENNFQRVIIRVKKGIYKQKLNITKAFITLIGEDAENTIITFDDYARKPLLNGDPMRTFNSYSVFIAGDNFIAENITFENTAGAGSVVGQAVAAYVDGDRMQFKNCRFLANQDTLFTGPLPPKPMEGSTFGGPREGQERRNSRQYYESCYIEGDIDFIFGSATVVFNKCMIFSKNRGEEINGYITAASTPGENKFGYVFVDCKLISDAKEQSVYLGRPWRDFAKTAYINCWMGEHIISEGWHNWNKTSAEKLVCYVEYKSYGPGAALDKRVSFSKILNDTEVEKYSIINVLAGNDNWNPSIC